VLRRIANGVAEFFVISIWESYEAISRFTGSSDVSKAIYKEEDYKHLCFPETHVIHFEVEVGEGRFFRLDER
jgi:heme-degrading monooxygenase HmoA